MPREFSAAELEHYAQVAQTRDAGRHVVAALADMHPELLTQLQGVDVFYVAQLSGKSFTIFVSVSGIHY
jgi:hypothetical protein